MNYTNRSLRDLLMHVVLAFCVLSACSIVHAGSIEVTASALNVRSGPSTSNEKLGLIRSGQKYSSLTTQGDWHQIDFDERKGWVHGAYVRAIGDSVVTVNVNSKLNVRAGAGTQYRDVGDTYNGQSWVVIATSGAWRKVNFRGGGYWLHSSYLSSNGSSNQPNENLPTSSAGLVQVPSTADGLRSYSESAKRWGTPKVVYGLLRAASKRIRDNSDQGRVSVGNISRSDGSKPSSVHSTHHSGRYADMRPLGKGKYEGRIDIREVIGLENYSRSRTRTWISTYLRNEYGSSMRTPLFNDQTLNDEGVSNYYSGHHNHIHVQVNN